LDEQGVAEQLAAQALEKGLEFVGPKRAAVPADEAGVGTALEAEMSEQLG
jgi:hypothetical protein